MKKILASLLVLTLFSAYTFGQGSEPGSNENAIGQELNAILTTVPFMTIAPDSRGSAMGDAGVATSPDIFSQHWNSSKYLFMEERMGAGTSYTPWLQNLGVKDINLLYLSGYYKLDDRQAVSAGLRYFNLGSINLTDNTGNSLGTRHPNEFALDAGYGLKLSEYLGGGLVLRFIYSNIAGGAGAINNLDYNPGVSYGADLSTYYERPIRLGGYNSEMAFGGQISNIGSKMAYSEGNTKEFIPTNLRLGGRLTVDMDDYNSISVTTDLNKLLVPTPPEMNGDTLIAGRSDDVTTIPGMIQSFYDAPGVLDDNGDRSVFKEEMREIMISAGVEYWYLNQFALRAGYFHEHQSKGNRKFLTVGFGLKLNVFTFDFSYLSSLGRQSPLNNTMRVTLGFIFE